MSDDDDTKDRLGRAVAEDVVLEGLGELAGGAADAAAAALGLAVSGPAGAVAGPAVRRVGAEILRPAAATRRMDAANLDVTHEAAMRVPALEERLARLERLAPTFQSAITELRSTFAAPSMDFVEHVVREVDRLGLSWEELAPEFHEALRLSFQRTLDTIDRAVLPSLARLTLHFRDRPVDRNFRNVARMLVDLDGQEFGQLRELVAGARRADLAWRAEAPTRPHEATLTLVADILGNPKNEGVAWERPGREPALSIPPRSGVVAALVRTGVAQQPAPQTQPVAYDTGVVADRRVLELRCSMLDLLEAALDGP